MNFLTEEQQKEVNKISAEYPYTIATLNYIYINNGCSVEKTRKILKRMLVLGW